MFNRKKISELEDRIDSLNCGLENLKRENWNNKYPNGRLYIIEDTAIRDDGYFGTSTYTIHKLMFRDSYDSKCDFVIAQFDRHPNIVFKAKHIWYRYDTYLIKSLDEKYNYILDTSTNSVIQVDKDMKVVL